MGFFLLGWGFSEIPPLHINTEESYSERGSATNFLHNKTMAVLGTRLAEGLRR
jgi:hypothetical protein